MEILTFSWDALLNDLHIRILKITIDTELDIPDIILLNDNATEKYYKQILNMYGKLIHVYVHQDLDDVAGLDKIIKYFEDEYRKIHGYIL